MAWRKRLRSAWISLKSDSCAITMMTRVILKRSQIVLMIYVDKGDPYQKECLQTTALMREHMGHSEDYLYSTFQSRFGPKAWLQPYTDKTLEKIPSEGVKNVAVMMPGFAADCLETLEEIKIEAHESFEEHGGENFTAVPCLNARPDHIKLLADLSTERLLNGWL